ncbi:LamG domain-containing protein [Candidatus Pacebacteria bacterium]|nr:LamG domain-containing protein [Candidatus Paceibacterota bacterium]
MVRTTRLFNIAKRSLASALLLVLLCSDLAAILPVTGVPAVHEAEAATGDFSIFRESAGTDTIPDFASSPTDVTWDTTVQADSNIGLQSNNSDIDLADGGKYLVLYNVQAEEGTSTAAQRRNWNTWLTLNDTPLEYGRGNGFIRDTDNILEGYANGAAIINAAAGDDLAVRTKRFDQLAPGGVNTRADTNGISVLKLKDSWDYLRIHKSASSTGISGNTSFTDVTWDTSDEVDTDSFTFSPTSADISLVGGSEKHFLVTTNVHINRTITNNTRENYELRLTLDGVEIPGTRVTAYPRGHTSQGDINDVVLAYSGIIKKDAASDQTLNLEVRRESSNSNGTTIIAGDRTAISIVALPDEASYVMLGNDSTTAGVSTRTGFGWNEQYEVDSFAFSHSTTTNNARVEIDRAGDYLFFSTLYAVNSTDERQPFRADWRKNGSQLLNYGGFGAYLRGNQAFSGGSSGGLIMDDLSISDFIEVTHFDETGAPINQTFQADRVAMQGVLLDDNFFGTDILVSALGSHSSETAVPNTDFYSGGSFVIKEQTASRNITDITLTESGTVDASVGLDNISLYYDLDTTFPYNCESESYAGTEPQFGATDTTGFSGADGVSSFTGSVAISTTASMCVYALYDVTSSASDGETVILSIDNPANDVEGSGGPAIGPVTPVAPAGQTTLRNTELTQIHYHWRADDGNETSATSIDGTEDTPAGGFQIGSPRRLRMAVSVEGTATSSAVQYRLQYGEKAGSCSAVGTWTDVAEVDGAWDVFNSANVTNGGDTTDVLNSSGGVTNEEPNFYGTAAQVDGSDKSVSTVLDPDEFIELEYTVTPTDAAVEGTTYCFRVTDETPEATHTYRLPLTVASSEIASDLSDFPVYVDLSTLGSHFFSNVASDGGDIRVTTADGTTEVAREVVAINTGASSGEMHFRAPTISSSADTTFYIYYGSATENEYQASSTYGSHGVWADNYAAVYHLAESGSTYIDSTSNRNDGIGEATDPSLTTGKLGDGQDFGGNGRIDLGTSPSVDLDAAGEYYVSAWINLDTSTGDQAPVAQYTAAGDFLLWADTLDAGTGFCHYNGSYLPDNCRDQNDQNVGTWQYLAAYHTGTAGGIYLDGQQTGNGPTTNTVAIDVAERFAIGAQNGDSNLRYFDGQIDEVRISALNFGADWSEAEFSNQNTPTTFYATSTFEALSVSPAVITYDSYPEGTINADIVVAASGAQVSTLDVGATSQYVGGTFAVTRDGTNRTLTTITMTETGSVDAANLTNPTLYYDLDTSDPFDCDSETYTGVETSIAGTAFSGPNGSTTFSGINEVVNTTTTLCGYLVFDIDTAAANAETIAIEISNPSEEVVVTGSTVGPSSAISPTGSSTLSGPILTQIHYHWRNDNGDETDTGATSATDALEDTPVISVPKESTRRLRVQVSNEGAVSSQATQYVLQYGTKVSTCEAVGSWTTVGDTNAAFDMVASDFIADGNTTDIDNAANGAMTEENTTFVGTGALRESLATSSAITLSSTQYTELEYSIAATTNAGFDTTYCFRLSGGQSSLEYSLYPELVTREKQDFFIQRGSEEVSGSGVTLVAGADYIAPAATSAAFVRISNMHHTGAGDNLGTNGQFPRDVTAHISDQSDITTGFTITRPPSAINTTRVDWEIIEYIGLEGADNEMVVRDVGEVGFAAAEFTNTGATISNVTDQTDIVVFVTGQSNDSTSNSQYNDGLFTADWDQAASSSEFERGDADVSADVSYAVVEFTGLNWQIQRVEHQYTVAGETETESISALSGFSRAFIHAQKRVGEGLQGIDEGGHHVWISSIGFLSFELMSTANTPSDQYSVAWVLENTQSGDGALVSYPSSVYLDQPGVAEPLSTITPIGATVNTENSSVFGTSYSAGNGTTYPRLHAALTLASSTDYEFWQSDTNNDHWYRVEVVEWPVAELSFLQNYYRFYTDNDTLTPDDPWPTGAPDLGENTSITGADDPLGEGERVRIRMSLQTNNAILPAEISTFKLQYGRRTTSCFAIESWDDLGAAGSGSIWRGYDATPSDGTELPSSVLSGIPNAVYPATYEEENTTAVNPNGADIGEDIEFDWHIEHNGATQLSDYCFRMVELDGSELVAYNNYPTLRTTGYTPVVGNWRWYNDATSTTPLWPMANENTAPINVSLDDEIKLRVTASEVEGAPGANVKFKLQYSEFSDFSAGVNDVESRTTCGNEATTTSNIWCYTDGGGDDNDIITTALLSDADSCSGGIGDGCGIRNELADSVTTLNQSSLSNMEFEFALRQDGARANAVYYFRLYDVTNDVPIFASSSYPSLSIEGATLSLTVSGLPAGTTNEGVTADITTTPTSIPFGTLTPDTEYEAMYQLSVDTTATEGYQLFMYAAQPLANVYGEEIPDIAGTNDTPTAWSAGCTGVATGCFGYHTGDDVLFGGSTRFAADDSYAAISTSSPEEIMHSSVPIEDTTDIVFKLEVSDLQPAGDYDTEVIYLVVPAF